MTKKLLLATALGTVLAAPAMAQTTLQLTEVITSPERTQTLREIVAQFEEAHPDVTVEITSLPWGQAFEKFATMVSAGNTPDVVEMPDKWLALYAENGALESLEPYLEEWENTEGLNERTLEVARTVDDTAYTLPYGYYMRALFYNKDLFAEAGVEEPPTTMEEFEEAARKVSELPGKYGYCLRGGAGGYTGWLSFGANMAGDGSFFTEDGTSTLADDGWVQGYQWLIDLYENGYAPQDSVNWGFNEIVAGFYSGTCAMLDQDPDALIAISERMDEESFGVTPFPKGPSGKSFPTLGYAGWSMFSDSENKDLAWELIAALSSEEGNLAWNKRTGTLPIYSSLEEDPFYDNPAYAAFFDALADPDTVPLDQPFQLKEYGFFTESLVPRTSQEALLGQVSAEDMAAEWADYMTKAYQAAQ